MLLPFLCSIASGQKDGFRGESFLVFLFGAVAAGHPILTEQLYFTLQSAEVVFSFLLLELCLLGAHCFGRSKNPLWILPAVVLLQIPFSTYQAFVPLFITGAVGMALLQSLFTEKKIRDQAFYILRLILVFLPAFLFNQLITRLFFSEATYLSEQFYWKEEGFFGGVLNIFAHIRDACLGLGTFYFIEFGILCFALLLLMILHWRKETAGGKVLWQFFLLAAWYATPFYLSFLLGNRPVIRAQLVLPLTTAGTAFLCCLLFLRKNPFADRKLPKRIFGLLLAFLCFVTVYQEASVTSGLYYTESVRKQGDLSLAASLQESIAEFTGEADYSGPVIFWGHREAASNASCIQGDIMGQSFFNWDTDVEPFYYYSSFRIVDFLNTLGSSYRAPSAQEVQAAGLNISDVPCYPAKGSIVWVGDTVVVKLSDD
jgi:hypothetical protein